MTYSSDAAVRLREAGTPGSWAAAVAEALRGLRFLVDHPRIDAKRIAIVGFSFGGEVAYLAAFEPICVPRSCPAQTRFAAHVAYYPAGVFGAAAECRCLRGCAGPDAVGGEGRQPAPVAKAQGYFAYAREAGFPPPVWKCWSIPALTMPGRSRRSARRPSIRNHRSTRKCPYLLLGPSQAALLDRGP